MAIKSILPLPSSVPPQGVVARGTLQTPTPPPMSSGDDGIGSLLKGIVSLFGDKPDTPAPAIPQEPLESQKTPATKELDTSPQDFDSLGSISAKFESGGKGVETISSGRGDPGGKSYGEFQLASRTGTLKRYLNQSKFREDFKGLRPGTSAFDNKYREIVETNAAAFSDDQKDFIKRTHFDPLKKQATKLGIPNHPAIDEALFSMGVQHGKAKVIVKKAARRLNENSSVEDVLQTLYEERIKYTNGLRSLSSKVKRSLRNRYNRELVDALTLAIGI